jgi:thioredoxin 1
VIAKILMGVCIGACAGVVLGYFGKCSSGACPLTANPYRGAAWGGLMGFLIVLASCSPPREAEKPEQEDTESPAAPAVEGERDSEGKGKVLHVRSESDFKSRVLEAQGVCLVDLYSMRCPPCRALAPIISSLAEKYTDRVTVCKVDIDEVQSVAQRYGLKYIPTVLFVKNGEEVDRFVGLRREGEYVARLDKILSSG